MFILVLVVTGVEFKEKVTWTISLTEYKRTYLPIAFVILPKIF